MIDITPAVQLFTLRDYIQTPEGFADSIRRVREMGCDTVQFSRLGASIPADFITDVIREYDMKVCVTHSPMQRIFHDLPKLIHIRRGDAPVLVWAIWRIATLTTGMKDIADSFAILRLW